MELITSLGKSRQNIRIALAEDRRLEGTLNLKHIVEAIIKELLLFSYLNDKVIEIPLVAAWKCGENEKIVSSETESFEEVIDPQRWPYTLYFWSFEQFCKILIKDLQLKRKDFDLLHKVLFELQSTDDNLFDAVEIFFLKQEGTLDEFPALDVESKKLITIIVDHLKNAPNEEIRYLIREATLYFRLLKLIFRISGGLERNTDRCNATKCKNIGYSISPKYSVPDRFRSFREVISLDVLSQGYSLISLRGCDSCINGKITGNIINNYLQPLLVDFFKELCTNFLPDVLNNTSHNVKFLIFLEQSSVKKNASLYKNEWLDKNRGQEENKVPEMEYPIISKVVGDLQKDLLTLSGGRGFVPMFFLRFEDKLNYVLSNEQHDMLNKNKDKDPKDPITGLPIGKDQSLYQERLHKLSEDIAIETKYLNSIRKITSRRKAFLLEIFTTKKRYVDECIKRDKSDHKIATILETLGVTRNLGSSHTVLRSGYPEIIHSWIMDPRTITIDEYPQDLFIYESTLPDKLLFFPLELSGVSIGICGLDKDVYIGAVGEEAIAIITRKTPELFMSIINTIGTEYVRVINEFMINTILKSHNLSNKEQEKLIIEKIINILNKQYLVYFFKETQLPTPLSVEEGAEGSFKHYHLHCKPNDQFELKSFSDNFKPYNIVTNEIYKHLISILEQYKNKDNLNNLLSDFQHTILQSIMNSIEIYLPVSSNQYYQNINTIIRYIKMRASYLHMLSNFMVSDKRLVNRSAVIFNIEVFKEYFINSGLFISQIDQMQTVQATLNKWKGLFDFVDSSSYLSIGGTPGGAIHAILENLILNSIQHGSITKIYIRFENDNTFPVILYWDNGSGFLNQDIERISQWRKHGPITSVEKENKKGYGYWLIERIMNHVDGELEIISYPDNSKVSTESTYRHSMELKKLGKNAKRIIHKLIFKGNHWKENKQPFK